MKTRIITAVWFVAATTYGAMAADYVWNYAECVDYAKTHNITLLKLRLNEETAGYDEEEAKAQWQPSLDFGTNHSYSNLPWGNTKNSYNGQLGLNAGWTLWNGGAREKNIERSKINAEISRINTDEALRTLETDLLQVYLNILYDKENILIFEETEKLSSAQAERMKALMEAGKASKVDYAQLKAQNEQDKYNLVNAWGAYDTRRMELKKLLQLGIDCNIELADVEITAQQILMSLPPLEESYKLAVENDLQLRGLRLEQDGADIDVDIAKASGRPNISLNAGVGTGYYAPGGAFGNQLKQGFNENIGLSLTIPILDNKHTRMAVAKAKVQQLSAELDSDQRYTDLAQEVENWYIDTRSAQSRYLAAIQQVESAQISSDLTNEQFALGLVNTIELMTSHNNLLEARQALLQAKYMALLGQKMIEYYRTTKVTI